MKPFNTPRKTFSPFAILLVLASLLFASGCDTSDTDHAPQLRPVRTVEVSLQQGGQHRSFTGVARAGVESTLSFKVPGTLAKVAVNVGDRVSKKDLVAQLDPSDYALQLESTQANLTQAKAQARNAHAAYERVSRLYENNNASKNELDSARAQAESAEARVNAAEKQLQLAQLQLDYTKLRAKVNCAIARVFVEVGENVSAGQRIAAATCGRQVEVNLTVPESYIGRIKKGQQVSVQFDALPSRRFSAEVTEVGVAATGTTTAYPITVELTENAEEVRSGMAADVHFRFAAAQTERMVIPAMAVMEDRQGRYVFVVRPEGDGTARIQRKAVTIGRLSEEGMEITSGLSPGEQVVTAGVSRITDGQKVKWQKSPTQSRGDDAARESVPEPGVSDNPSAQSGDEQ